MACCPDNASGWLEGWLAEPNCVLWRTTTIPTPHTFALAIAMGVALTATTVPEPLWAPTSASAGDSFTTVDGALGSTLRYWTRST